MGDGDFDAVDVGEGEVDLVGIIWVESYYGDLVESGVICEGVGDGGVFRFSLDFDGNGGWESGIKEDKGGEGGISVGVLKDIGFC